MTFGRFWFTYGDLITFGHYRSFTVSFGLFYGHFWLLSINFRHLWSYSRALGYLRSFSISFGQFRLLSVMLKSLSITRVIYSYFRSVLVMLNHCRLLLITDSRVFGLPRLLSVTIGHFRFTYVPSIILGHLLFLLITFSQYRSFTVTFDFFFFGQFQLTVIFGSLSITRSFAVTFGQSRSITFDYF